MVFHLRSSYRIITNRYTRGNRFGLERQEISMESAKGQWNAGDYAKNSSAQLKWAEELIAKLDLAGYESVLDIGCGAL